MALRRVGRYPEALDELRRGHELGSRRPGWRYPSALWVRECEQLVAMAGRLPALLKGDDRPRDAAERLVLAKLCYDTGRHAAAARFWGEALEADPKLGDDRRALHRYHAACAAALAAAGKGEDDPKSDDAARPRLRSQAQGWLRNELAVWSKALDSADPKARGTVALSLRHWKEDSDLAGVRGGDALATLPESERTEWQALWADVDALLKKTQAARP
jgi:hypothetical protein